MVRFAHGHKWRRRIVVFSTGKMFRILAIGPGVGRRRRLAANRYRVRFPDLTTRRILSIFKEITDMLKRDKLINTIRQLPDSFSVDEVIDRIIVLEKIERGLDQSKKGQVTADKD